MYRGGDQKLHQLTEQWDQLVEFCIPRTFESNDGAKQRLQFIVPSELQLQILEDRGRSSGRIGETQTFTKSGFTRLESPLVPGNVARPAPVVWLTKDQPRSIKEHPNNIKVGYPLEMMAMDIVGHSSLVNTS